MNSNELRYMEIIKRRFPQLDLSKIEFNKTDGTYSDVAVINNEVAFKFAKFDWSAAYLRNEADVIRFIQGFVTMPLPDVEMIGQNVSRHAYIKGSPLYRNTLLKLDYRTRDNIAKQIATFLKELHSIPVKKVKLAGIGDSAMNRGRDDWLDELKTMKIKISPYCTNYVREYLNQITRPVVENKKFFEFQPVLIHGNLTPNHILFDEASGNVNGIIGFSDAGLGDPAYDFGTLLDHLGENFVRKMFKYYPASSAFMERARFYAFISNFMWFRDVCDMITTRDFSRFQVIAKDRDILPPGTPIFNRRD